MNDKRKIIKAEIDKYIKDDKLDFLYCYNPYLYKQICNLSADNIFVSKDALRIENRYCYKYREFCYEHDRSHCDYKTPNYPIYTIFIDKKGHPYKTLLGWYTEKGDKSEVRFNFDNIYYEPVYAKTHLFQESPRREKFFKVLIFAVGVLLFATLLLTLLLEFGS